MSFEYVKERQTELLAGCMRRMTWDGKDSSNLFMPQTLEIKEKMSITILITGTTCSIP